MATIVFQYAGAAIGGAVGGPLGALAGRALGGLAGGFVDQALFGQKGSRHISGPRLNDLHIMSSSEGEPIPRLWGRMRLAGQVIWASDFEEEIVTHTEKVSAKGRHKAKSTVTEYFYYANFAIGLCEGPIDRIGRVWADGKEIDLSYYTTRFYPGSEDQRPDSLIIAKEGADGAPAYRGLAYLVFEHFPLKDFGNRLPQLSFELIRHSDNTGHVLRAVTIIPGATEFGYDPKITTTLVGPGTTISENTHSTFAHSDWSVALDQLTATSPNMEAVALVVSWFGTDLNCGSCEIKPAIDQIQKITQPEEWQVCGVKRDQAHLVSRIDQRPAYGGTPSDACVIRALIDLKARGLRPIFYPFIMMDIPPDNHLADPYGDQRQAPYPWRGRISCDRAPGQANATDNGPLLESQIKRFLGTAQPQHFQIDKGQVIYKGPGEWRYRRMILHYATLCATVGGVEAFLIGSELRGLTQLRAGRGDYPFVKALVQLAAEVKAILPEAKVSYAADWSEYFGHHLQDGSGDVCFHLDPLWASPAIDFIGIDNYMPLSDWRDGEHHLDRKNGVKSIYDKNYLTSNITGGEGYDWYYQSKAARLKQERTPIIDTAYGKDWLFRYKDLKGWWQNRHFDRYGGVELSQPTPWIPESKPIWFTEAGCPAIDKGTNEPNKFLDAKSSESALPHFSKGARDDFMQNCYVSTLAEYWRNLGPHNPHSSHYDGTMVHASRIFFWCWDARPYPVFPARNDLWSDCDNYNVGHWLNGRIGAIRLAEIIAQICRDYGLDCVDVTQVEGVVDGYRLDRVMSGREALEDLLTVFGIEAVEKSGTLTFSSRSGGRIIKLTARDLVEKTTDAPLYSMKRGQTSDLPGTLRIGYIETARDYRICAVETRRQIGASMRVSNYNIACAINQTIAQARADILLQEAWSAREELEFNAPPSCLALEPGDVIQFEDQPFKNQIWRINSISDGIDRKIQATSFCAADYKSSATPERMMQVKLPPIYGAADIAMMDLALASTKITAHAPWIAAQSQPWPGNLAVLKKIGSASLDLNRYLNAQATMGRLLNDFLIGPQEYFDRGNRPIIELAYGALSSITEAALLEGGNLAAIGDEKSGWEIIQFSHAELIAPKTYRLGLLLRAQGGSLPEMLHVRSPGSRFVLLNAAIVQPILSLAEAAREITWLIGPSEREASHSSYQTLTIQTALKGLRPLSPCQLRLHREREGLKTGFRLTWIRRTRLDGEAWELSDVPLGEEEEAYELTILKEGGAVRTITVFGPTYFYEEQLLKQDFGHLPRSLSVRLCQLSRLYGQGAFIEEILYV